MRHIFRARKAGAVVVLRERRGFFILDKRGGICGNTGGSHGDHRGGAGAGGGGQRAAAPVQRICDRADGRALPGAGREHHLGGAGRTAGRDLRPQREDGSAGGRKRQNAVLQRHYTDRRQIGMLHDSFV